MTREKATAPGMRLRAKSPSRRTLKNFMAKKQRRVFKAMDKARSRMIFNTRLSIEREIGIHPKYRHGLTRNDYNEMSSAWEQRYMAASEKRRPKIAREAA